MERRPRRSTRHVARCAGAVAALALLPPLLAGCSGGGALDRTRSPHGVRLEVLGAWSGAEAQRFRAVLARFTADTGTRVGYTSAGDAGVPDVLARRLAAGDPPDIALLPQPGLLRRLAAEGQLVRPGPAVVREVRRNYSAEWRRLGSFAGRTYGVWFKAADKSLVWYDVAAFERTGVVPPTSLDGLRAVSGVLAGAGLTPWAVGGGSGWTLTDWFENLLLCRAGPHTYDLLAEHRIPWTDPAVRDALGHMATILRPAHLAGGVAAATRTDFERAVTLVFGRRPEAVMVQEADFVAGVISARTTAQLGVDADAFPFPCGRSVVPTVVAGGDVAVALQASTAADGLLGYLASPASARVWARRGGFLTPNLELDLAAYPDPLTRAMARSLLDAGENFRFDLSDLQPPAFGGTERTGMQPLLREFLRDRDPARTARLLEAAARRAFGADAGSVSGSG